MRQAVPGYCAYVKTLMTKFDFNEINDMLIVPDIRKEIKKRIVDIQRKLLFSKMLEASKTDGMLLNFKFDGTAISEGITI